MKKYWPLPLVASRVENGSFVIPTTQSEKPSGIGSTPTGIPFLSFEPLPWNQMRRLLTSLFCCNSGEMIDLFLFDDFVKFV